MLRFLLAISLVIGVSGCVGADFGRDGVTPRSEVKKQHLVSEGRVVVAGPDGYCIDVKAIRENDQGAFVPLGACASISGRLQDGVPDQRFFLSAVVKPLSPDMPKEAVVPAARKALELDSVRSTLADEILDMRAENNALIVHSRHKETPDGLAQDQWRAMFACRDHVVALTVTGFEGQEADGEKALLRFLDAMRRVNPDGKSAGARMRSLFGRLLN